MQRDADTLTASTEGLPLEGTLVLDLGRELAAPYCAQVLSDLGADVIKVESPTRPDDMRRWPPSHDGLGAYFAVANRNKRCMSLDLKTDDGYSIFSRLVEGADIVVENFRSDVPARLRLDYESLARVNPRVVLCSVRSYGEGPLEGRPAYDAAIQAYTGIMSVTGEPDGGVQRVGVALVDFATGVWAASGCLAALHQAETTGRGSRVEVSLFDTGVAMMAYHLTTLLLTGNVIQRAGTNHPAMAPTRVFEAQDGSSIMIVVVKTEQYEIFCKVLGHPEWLVDARFATNADRVQNRAVLHDLIAEEIRTRPRDVWAELLEQAGVPFAPVNTVEDLAADQTVRDRMLGTIARGANEVTLVRSPIRIDGHNLPMRSSPPNESEHTDEILRSLGLSAEDIDGLHRARVVA